MIINSGKFQKYTGFTLAEVLITLGIIGIVAAMTIPALMNNIQDKQFKEAWKKEYSTIMQAINMVYADEGMTYNNKDFPNWESMPRYFCRVQNKLKVVESGINCEDVDNINMTVYANWPTTGKIYWHADDKWRDKNNQLMRTNAAYTKMSAVLSDGAFITMICTGASEFLVDVNGEKPPNIVGKDIYYFILDVNAGKNKPTFWGSTNGCAGAPYYSTINETNYVSDCNSATGTGWGCSALTILGE